MNENHAIANLLFPNITRDISYFENMYPDRKLTQGACVTRFAPSPTGFMHLGGLFVALICQRLALQTNGVFFLRIEDTDKKREVPGGINNIISSLESFGIKFDEGVTGINSELGNYGPYKQSSREEIYKTFAKYLVECGLAYPCFCSETDLELIRNEQKSIKATPGYYGKWAKHRNINYKEVEQELQKGKKFVIRLKAPINNNRISYIDLIKGKLEMPENDQDIVLLKSDGIPTYHFAHIVDDHLMKTTHVIRGEEWLSSIPIHLQLFKLLNWEAPKYAHIPTIMKIEGSSKRKLSKRKDPENAISYYNEQGYPSESVIDYLLNLANSNFEDWRRDNPNSSNFEFELNLDRIGSSGAVFDIVKLSDISKDRIALMTAAEVYDKCLEWANKYDNTLAKIMEKNKDYTINMLNIEREIPNPRKDFAKWKDLKPLRFYFFDELFLSDINENGYTFSPSIDKSKIVEIISGYLSIVNVDESKVEWLNTIRKFCVEMNYAEDMKTFKANKDLYKGHIGDVTGIIRIALCNRSNTPDLYEIMKVMGISRVKARLEKALEMLER